MSQSGFDLEGFYCKEETEMHKMRDGFLKMIEEDQKQHAICVEEWRALGKSLPKSAAEMTPYNLHTILDGFLKVYLSRCELNDKMNTLNHLPRI